MKTMSGVQNLRLRASLLSCFELEWLGIDELDQNDVADLLSDCGRTQDASGIRRWRLSDAARRDVLEGASYEEARSAWLDLSVRPADATQLTIDQYMRHGGPPPVADLTETELRRLGTVMRWLAAAGGPNGSDERLIRSDLARKQLLGSLQSMVRPAFLGREQELAVLAEIADHRPSAVLISGTGGIGKTALLVQRLLDVQERGTPVAYLTFDHAGLDPMHPVTLVESIARQMAIFVHQEAPALETLAELCRRHLRSSDIATAASDRGEHGQIGNRSADDHLTLLGQLLGGRRLTIAIDTVEEVQRRGPAAIEGVRRFLEASRKQLGNVEILIAGRAAVPEWLSNELVNRSLELSGLSVSHAARLLRHLVDAPGRIDLAETIRRVGTSPLTIRLAAGILNQSVGDAALLDLRLRRVGVDGELYRRLLGHIEDERIRRLAYPGLTLRRISPDLIRVVLAGPCEVDVPDQATASQLFEMLAREAVLVEVGEDRELLHRRDIRALMIRTLTTDFPDVVKEIHERAVEYYTSREGVADRSEELYHRLMLAQSTDILDVRWESRSLESLMLSLDELPSVSKAYLAARTEGLDIPDGDLREAGATIARRIVVARVSELLAQTSAGQALDELISYERDRGDQDPEVQELRITALEILGRTHEALEVAIEGRFRAARSASPANLIRFTLHQVRLLEQVGRLGAANESIAEVLENVRSLPQSTFYLVQKLRLLAAQLRMHRLIFGSGEISNELVSEVRETFAKIPLRTVAKSPGLLRDLAAEVGDRSTEILGAALSTIGWEPANEESSTSHRNPRLSTDRRARGLEDAERVAHQGLSIAGRDQIVHSYAAESDDARASRYIITIEIVAFSSRTSEEAESQRRALRQMAQAALEDNVTSTSMDASRGDGLLLVLPGTAGTAWITTFARRLTNELIRYNRDRSLALRLRVAITRGIVSRAQLGWTGQSIIAASRLVDSAAVRKALMESGSHLVLVIADAIHRELLSDGFEIQLDFQSVTINIGSKGFAENVWISAVGRELHSQEDALRAPVAEQGNGGIPDHALISGKRSEDLEFREPGPVQIRILGAVQVTARGLRIPLAPKPAAVLLALALARGRMVPAEQLIELLWPEEVENIGAEPEFARYGRRSTLRSHVAHLRKSLIAASPAQARPIVLADEEGYRLQLGPDYWLDANAFGQLLDGALAAMKQGSAERAGRLARSALDLWNGAPDAGLRRTGFVDAEIRRLTELRYLAIELKVESDLALGRHADVLTELRELTRDHPLRLALHRFYILAAYRSELRSEALAAYDVARAALDVTGIDVSPLVQLRDEILALELDVNRAPVAMLGRRGPVRLHRGVRGFVGRDDEVAHIVSLMDSPAEGTAPLVIFIYGMPGIGKTALVDHIANRVQERFDVVLSARLDRYGSNPSNAQREVSSFLRLLQVAEAEIPREAESAAALFGVLLSDRRALIVVDDAARAADVEPFIPSGPGHVVLVTSRAELLELDGGHRIRLDALSPPDAIALLSTFVTARQLAAEPQSVGDLIQYCGAMPLALRIVGALLRSHPGWSLERFYDWLIADQAPLKRFNVGDRDLATAIYRSYVALSTEQAHLLLLLAALRIDDVSVEVTAALIDQPSEEAEARLRGLEEAQLMDSQDVLRYRMHHVVRLFAEQVLAESGESSEPAVTRVLELYLRRLKAVDTRLFETSDQDSGYAGPGAFATDDAAEAWMNAELVNLVALAGRPELPGGTRFVIQLNWLARRYFDLHSLWYLWEITAGAAHAAAVQLHDDREAGYGFRDGGIIAARRGDFRGAAALFDRSCDLLRQAGDAFGEAAVANNLAVTQLLSGDLERAIPALIRARDLFRQLGAATSEMTTLMNLGEAYRRNGQADKALGQLENALRLARQMDQPVDEGRSLYNLGELYRELGNAALARDFYERGLEVFHRNADDHTRALTLYGLAALAAEAGDLRAARQQMSAALEILDRLQSDEAYDVRAHLDGLGL